MYITLKESEILSRNKTTVYPLHADIHVEIAIKRAHKVRMIISNMPGMLQYELIKNCFKCKSTLLNFFSTFKLFILLYTTNFF